VSGLVVVVLSFPTRASAGSNAITTCVKEGVCALTLEATTTWIARLPPISLRSPVEGAERATLRRPGSALFPVGFALDLRIDSPGIFVPVLGMSAAFAPGSGVTAEIGNSANKRTLELGDMQYVALLLPGLGIHLTKEDRPFRVSASARAVFSTFVLSGVASGDGQRGDIDGRAPFGWGVMGGVEACADVIGKRRGLCGFLQGTQAYSSGLQHAVTTGFRIVF
jgi:hypothetical protein